MRFKTCVTATATAALLALGLSAFAPGSAHAAVRPASLGPGWSPIQLHAYSGNGCAIPSSDARLAPIISYPCGSWTWYYRFLNGTDEVELVDPSGSYALGISGGAWKMETPSDSSTYVIMANGLTGYSVLLDSTRTYGMGPQGKGSDVLALTSPSSPADNWDLISG
jgi:hypothetical protein